MNKMQIDKIAIWKERRQAVLKKLKGPLLFRGASQILRNGDVHYSFRQDSDFFYLCGFPEPDSLLLAIPEKNGSHKTILFVPPRDPKMEVWNGKREGVKCAIRNFGVDEAYPAQDFWKVFQAEKKRLCRLSHLYRQGVEDASQNKNRAAKVKKFCAHSLAQRAYLVGWEQGKKSAQLARDSSLSSQMEQIKKELLQQEVEIEELTPSEGLRPSDKTTP